MRVRLYGYFWVFNQFNLQSLFKSFVAALRAAGDVSHPAVRAASCGGGDTSVGYK